MIMTAQDRAIWVIETRELAWQIEQEFPLEEEEEELDE